LQVLLGFADVERSLREYLVVEEIDIPFFQCLISNTLFYKFEEF